MQENDEKQLTGYPSIDRPWLKYYTDEELDIKIPSCSIYANMYRHSANYGEKVAFQYLGKRITYAEFFNKIEEVACALKVLGIKEKEVVSVCLPNIPEAWYCFYAINRIGAIANMLDVRCGAPTLISAIKESASKILFCLDSVADKLANIKTETKIHTAVAVSPIDCFPSTIQFFARMKNQELRKDIPDGFITWKTFEKHAKDEEIIDCWIDENSDAVIAYTGGTTGEPKGVIGTNRNINAVAEMELKIGFNQTPYDSILCIAPPWTYYGLCNSVHVPLCMGLRIMLIPKLMADELADVMLKLKPNHVVTVPSALNILLSGKYDNSDFSFLRSIIVGADKLDESMEIRLNDYFHSHGCTANVSKGYGMTEVMAAAAYSRLNANEVGSVGIPYPLNDISAFKQCDDGYKECLIGEQGEIAIYGPTVMRSYFGKFSVDNLEILKTHSDGKIWVHTGDIGYVGKDGRIYIVGRLKRMFVKNGYKVFPATIEHCILQNQNVDMAAVVAIEDKTNGYVTKAFIVLKQHNIDIETVKAGIMKSVAENLYEYELPDIYEFVKELPLTGMGKIDYKALESQVAG